MHMHTTNYEYAQDHQKIIVIKSDNTNEDNMIMLMAISIQHKYTQITKNHNINI